MPAGLSGLGLSVIPLCENIDPPPVLKAIDDRLPPGVWPPTTLFCMLGDVLELDGLPCSALGGYKPVG